MKWASGVLPLEEGKLSMNPRTERQARFLPILSQCVSSHLILAALCCLLDLSGALMIME